MPRVVPEQPNAKKPDELKSQLLMFRLHPTSPQGIENREDDAFRVVANFLSDGKDLRTAMTIVLCDYYDRHQDEIQDEIPLRPEMAKLVSLEQTVKELVKLIKTGKVYHPPDGNETTVQKQKPRLHDNALKLVEKYMNDDDDG